MKKLTTLRRFSCILTALILCAAIAPTQAATIAVTANAPDVLNGANASCSLREAITNINNGALTYADCPNTGAAYGTSDTINIPAGTYTTTIATANENLNANGDYDILASVTIVGAGAGSTIIDGGAIDRVFHIPVALTVSISGVTIQNGNSVLAGSVGGGIYNWAGTLTVTNSTITSNSVGAGTVGGGILNQAGTLTVTNSTIVRNTAGAGQGGGYRLFGGTGAFTNSIVADNGVGTDCVGVLTDSGNNIDSDGTCGTFTQNAAMVQGTGFGALASNGGPTQTHALLAGSAAIDAGNPAVCAAAPVSGVDQRGIVRPQGIACDIGAYELVLVPAVAAASGIPTLSEWALLALAGLVGLFGMGAMRRRSEQGM